VQGKNVAERSVSGITIEEDSGPEQAISRVPTSVTAFVGRTLKGPVNQPLEVRSFQEFALVFGGLWQPSPLSYAIEQYFENGGRRAIVVRVANGGRPPTLTLAAGGAPLRLAGLAPGTREYLRAAVDYDGLRPEDRARFNLVVQRVRAPGSELIDDQEIFPRLSVAPESTRFVADVLSESRLVRLVGAPPATRPLPTVAPAGTGAAGYVASNSDGDDGAPLTDYDLIGSAVLGTGIFALRAAPYFSLLCIPPLARELEVGAAALLVAGRFCREHHALLLVDPPAAWTTVEGALAGQRDWPFRSDHAVMYFPRLVAFDRLRGRHEIFGSAAAAAGLIARADESYPVWAAADESAALRPGLRPACAVSEAESARLASLGINVLAAVRAPGGAPRTLRTLASGTPGSAGWQHLGPRRLALLVVASIERGTRWMQFSPNGPATWARARAQVSEFLEALAAEGAFGDRKRGENYFVICDRRVNDADAVGAGRVSLLYGIAASRPGEFHACLVSHEAGASRSRVVTVNRLATCGKRVEAEIEAAIIASGVYRSRLRAVT
jgi:phage tail sheath protein FI